MGADATGNQDGPAPGLALSASEKEGTLSDDSLSRSKLTPTTSTPTLRSPSTSTSPQRSPEQKRKAPASHSSYGVETSLGPPPSYSTQRTLSEDRVRGLTRSSSQRAPLATGPSSERVGLVQQSNTHAGTSQAHPRQAHDRLPPLPLPVSRPSSDPDICSSSPETVDSVGSAQPQDASDMSSDETAKSEDLFLNIAKADTAMAQTKATTQRSRVSLPLLSSSRPSTSNRVRSSPMMGHFDHELLTPQTDELRPGLPRSLDDSSQIGSAYVSRDGLDDSSHIRPHGDMIRSRRHSNANTDGLRPPARSHIGRPSRLVSDSSYLDRFRAVEQPATESTISTTAPSTVWDELDDLKSRIRKLELTGKLPPSSAAAMGTAERPRTATTQATTMSSSPKHKAPVSTLASQIEGIPSTIHPLLHEALLSAKAVVSHQVYQKLLATAQDALQLSAMISHEPYANAAEGRSLSSNERQIRRRTESMCRSLTELVISLLADQRSGASPAVRPASRDALSQPGSGLRSRRMSNEQLDRPPVASRVQSRLESRRSSLNTQFQSTPPAHPPAAYATPAAPAPVVSQSPSTRIHRTSTGARSVYAPSQLDGSNDVDNTGRPVSRAHTEVSATSTTSATHRALARDRAQFSREYTKQHPLPTSPTVVDAPVVSVGRTPLPSNVTFISRRLSSNHTTPQSAPAPQTKSIFHRQVADESAISPSQRPPFTISIERRNPVSNPNPVLNTSAELSPTALPQTPDSVQSTPTPRQPSARRSLGFTSKFSSVSSRLKAARAERLASASASRLPSNTDNKQALASPEMRLERNGSIGAVSSGNECDAVTTALPTAVS
ncbi:hypothetical protein DV738_g659, partial [Chaetothyriales sp. CBS 135597]